MDLMKTISIFVPSILTCRMIDFLVQVAPVGQAVINIIFIRVELAAGGNGINDYRMDRRLLHIR